MHKKKKIKEPTQNNGRPSQGCLSQGRLFQLVSDVKPAGDQPGAIAALIEGFKTESRHVLHGVTGSGKTFTVAHVIAGLDRPALVLVHNKTLAYQVYQELKALFPHNRVEYFISYFDYYQPESYLPHTDTYIEKDSRTNKEIELMRLRTTASLLTRRDVIVVCSISCIYGLGNPADWRAMACRLVRGTGKSRIELFSDLVVMQYQRADAASCAPGIFRVRGSVVDIMPGYEQKKYVRLVYEGQVIVSITEHELLTDVQLASYDEFLIFPARHFIVPHNRIDSVLRSIERELEAHAPTLPELERHRLIQRTRYDLELIAESGYCSGIENYSVHFDQRTIEQPPYCLLDFFPSDFLCVIDESHQSLPQAHAMYHGDRARKKNLIDYGFRLPSAYGNRPLTFEEFEKYVRNVLFVSATPERYELETSASVVEQIVRPTGLLDPVIEVREAQNQVQNLVAEAQVEIARGGRVLVTTLTKRMAEDLSEFLRQAGVAACYLHSEIKALERTSIIRQLRQGKFNVLVGVNLLREGLDIPEVSLVAILDADREGFLRDERSLIQTIGRAARNSNGRVIMYADHETESMRAAIRTTRRRRAVQERYNKKYKIIPRTIQKPVEPDDPVFFPKETGDKLSAHKRKKLILEVTQAMHRAAQELDFERAIELKNYLAQLTGGERAGGERT